MMGYKVGDEVIAKVRISEVYEKNNYPYEAVNVSHRNKARSIALRESDIIQKPDMTAEEAWEIAKKILFIPSFGGIGDVDLQGIFGTYNIMEIMKNNSPQEAKARIEAWEAEKEIKVGDVVTVSVYEGIVTRDVDEYGYCSLLFVDGDIGYYQRSSLKKTGRHVDIEGILKQIGGDE